MNRYNIDITTLAKKQLAAMPIQTRRCLDEAILQLRDNPRPKGVRKMKGRKNQWRIKVGNYRIVYKIYDDRVVVLIIRLGHRREVY